MSTVTAARVPQPAKVILRRLRFSQRAVARATGRSEAEVSRVLSGRRLPSDAFANAVAVLVGVPVESLFRPGRHTRAAGGQPRSRRERQRDALRAAIAPVLTELDRARDVLRALVEDVPA